MSTGAYDSMDDAIMDRTEHLSSLAVLSAGLSHEITNPLFVARSCLEMAEAELPELERLLEAVAKDDREALAAWRESSDPQTLGRRLREALEESSAAMKQAAVILQQVKSYVRQSPTQEQGDLTQLGRDVVRLVRLGFGRQVRIDGDLPAVSLDADDAVRLRQVLTNLVLNACQAVGPGGLVRVGGEVDGTGLVLRVCDSGPGIPDEILPRIFEPFFTTKPPGQGTGLGLAITRRLVTMAGGTLDVTRQDDWTVFQVVWPLKAASTDTAPPAPPSRPAGFAHPG